jgi:hypothetical protein
MIAMFTFIILFSTIATAATVWPDRLHNQLPTVEEKTNTEDQSS